MGWRMEFNHRSYEKGQTIAAIATPPGEGGIAVVRISGTRALEVADQIFSGSIKTYPTHTVHFGKIIDPDGAVLDEGLAIVMKTPRSYTGEDTVELHCHGGILISRKVLEAALKAGARMALPGEFTLKAFQNGKIDLTKAEAVQQIIASKSEKSWQAAEAQLDGKLYQLISAFQKNLIEAAAILEASVDFPEEGLEFVTKEALLSDLSLLLKTMLDLQNTFHKGRYLKTGVSLCFIGAPNVGKSSLMNALCGKERAIVTPIAGTTRDVLEESLQIGGIHIRLIDTAGIRQTDALIEKEGIRLSERAAKEADIILLVQDVTNQTPLAFTLPEKKTIAIWNKIDLPHGKKPPLPYAHVVSVSAKENLGIEALKGAIQAVIEEEKGFFKEEIILTSERHYQALRNATTLLKTACEGLESEISPELLVSDLRSALQELGTIIGMNVSEEVLSAIFSKFCVGK